MAIKTTVVGSRPQSSGWQFPCLGKTESGTVVLFSRDQHGVQLSGSQLGSWSEEWLMSQFTPLDPSEVVQLQNEP